MTDHHFQRHLSAALEAVRREAPAFYAMTAAAVGLRAVAIEVDGERLAVRRVEEAIEVVAWRERADVVARTSHATICDVLTGERTILDVLWTDALELRGGVADLLALEDALRAFIQGAVRAPSLPAILRSFRGPAREIWASTKSP